jgi:hypothetical protein
MSNFVLDAQIDTMANSEFTLIQRMLNNIDWSKSILILDRGFCKLYFYKLLLNKKITFCVRQKTSDHLFSKEIINNPSNDFITEWTPSEAEKATCIKKGLDANPIKVRVTKINLSSGEQEVLISNIFNLDLFTINDMKNLYHYRWGVEEAFKQLKPNMKLEQFGCKKTAGIYQEFYAQIIMMNITSLVAQLAEDEISQKSIKRKYSYKYNRVNAWKFTRDKIIQLYKIEQNKDVLSALVQQIRGSTIAIVPHRSFSRKHKFKRKNRFSPNYK